MEDEFGQCGTVGLIWPLCSLQIISRREERSLTWANEVWCGGDMSGDG